MGLPASSAQSQNWNSGWHTGVVKKKKWMKELMSL
jgi:hypothetical protein